MVFLCSMRDPEAHQASLVGLIPLLISVVLIGHALFAAPKESGKDCFRAVSRGHPSRDELEFVGGACSCKSGGPSRKSSGKTSRRTPNQL